VGAPAKRAPKPSAIPNRLNSYTLAPAATLVTTNKAFADWGEVFPNAACVVSLVDRLMHRAEVIRIEGDSYRAKEAQERMAARARQRSGKSGKAKT
jgi:DNA replication protein DnaC